MTISGNINEYIENSKYKGKLCRWYKSEINVFVTPITANIQNKESLYFDINKAIESWNNVLLNNKLLLKFNVVQSSVCADIIVHWVKVGRVFEGMCKYLSIVNGELRKIAIEVGLPNEYSGKNTTNESIYFAMMHEFGHALGLGHGVDVDDLMYVPHQKNISIPSDNDMFVLKQIYSI